MSIFKCPYCGIPLSSYNDLNTTCLFDGKSYQYDEAIIRGFSQYLTIYEYYCPECNNRTVTVKGTGKPYEQIDAMLLPTSNAKQYPDYIPLQIRQDYEEAHKILNLSPKASATLSRRCLQGMIRDFWNIRKNTLYNEISELEGKVTPQEFKVINSLRKLGNIGAHMEEDINKIVDIDENEAKKLLKLIELLIDKWYINRHDTEELYDDIITIDENKQNQRKS